MVRWLIMVSVAVGVAAGVLVLSGPKALSEPYSQIVDNSSSRFSAPGWGSSSYSPDRYGHGYRYAEPATGEPAARFKVSLPATARYTVYMRWPANGGYNGATRVAVRTLDGYKATQVNQQVDGGRWNKLGTYEMGGGDRTRIKISRRSERKGYTIADAIKVVRHTEETGGDANGDPTGRDVVRKAKGWLGVPYRYGGTSREGVDCSGLSLKVFESLDIGLPRTAADQYYSGRGTRVDTPKPGNLIFGHADGGSGIEHVGIVTETNQMIHAPMPGTVVRYDSFKNSWYHVVGIKRVVPNG